jgi:hypothetical protein
MEKEWLAKKKNETAFNHDFAIKTNTHTRE